jgi:hypothetical protein
VTRRGTGSGGGNEDPGSSGGEERGDGRPSGVPGGAGENAEGRPANARDASPDQVPSADAVPTVAPEERGETPETEHAPGADL